MKTKNRNPALLLAGKKVDPIIEFYFEFNHLKQLFRQGWLLNGVPEDKCESVADHLFSVCLLSLVIGRNYFSSLDITKLLEMAIIHEFGEINIGDVTPHDRIPKKVKYEWELKGIIEVMSKIPNGKHYISLWREYEEGQTPEAKFLRQIDYLEMGFQACIYNMRYNTPIDDFIRSTKKRLTDRNLINLFNETRQLLTSINQK